jgi:hypothetical protein
MSPEHLAEMEDRHILRVLQEQKDLGLEIFTGLVVDTANRVWNQSGVDDSALNLELERQSDIVFCKRSSGSRGAGDVIQLSNLSSLVEAGVIFKPV